MNPEKPIVYKKVWGTEEWIVNTSKYCGKRLILQGGGACCSMHRHERKDETFFVVEGVLTLATMPAWVSKARLAGPLLPTSVEVHTIRSGYSFRIKPGTWHKFWTDSPSCEFFEFSTRHRESDVERATKSKAAPKTGRIWTDL